MNKYNPHIHHRRSIRLKGYDYSQAGLYFITICCQDRICRFGHIENGEILNTYGKIAYDEWAKLPERFFPNFEMDAFQIMPNHMLRHYIIKRYDRRGRITPAENDAENQNDVGAYKSLVAKGCLHIYKMNNEIMGKLWQRNYYEHIIRNKQILS